MDDTSRGGGHTGAESAGVFTAGRRSGVLLRAILIAAVHEKHANADHHPARGNGAGQIFKQLHVQPRAAS